MSTKPANTPSFWATLVSCVRAVALGTLPWLMAIAFAVPVWLGLHALGATWAAWAGIAAFAVGFVGGCWMEARWR